MRSLFLAMLLALPAVIFAQSNYHDGYVVKSNGDTLKGFINYREWAYSPRSIEFKANKDDGQVSEFIPESIKSFEITGFENYISYVGLVSVNKNAFPDIPTVLDTTRRPGAIFLRQLATGSHITLYYNNEVSKNRFFIAEKNQAPAELKYYEYYGATRSSEEVKNVFRGQLLLYVYKFNNGDKTLISDVGDVKFEEHDLINIVDEINTGGLKNKEAGLRNGFKKSILRWFGGIGINTIASTYSYSGIEAKTINGNQVTIGTIYASQHSNTVAPRFDVGMDLFVNPEIQQFIFRTEVSYASLTGQFHQPATANFTEINLSYSGSSLIVMPQFLYNFYNQQKFKIFIGVGGGVNFNSYSGNKSSNTSDPDTFGAGSGALVQLQTGVVVNKRIELSFKLTSYTTNAAYSSVSVANQLTKTIGLNILLN